MIVNNALRGKSGAFLFYENRALKHCFEKGV